MSSRVLSADMMIKCRALWSLLKEYFASFFFKNMLCVVTLESREYIKGKWTLHHILM